MFKLAVISDSHWHEGPLDRFLRLCQKSDFDAIVHCGDGVTDARRLAGALSIPVYYVAGNCDAWSDVPREIVQTFGSTRVMAVHGHLYRSIRYDLSALSYRAEALGAAVALYGHTHRANVEPMGNVLLVNPGALEDGRYAVLELEEGKTPRVFLNVL